MIDRANSEQSLTALPQVRRFDYQLRAQIRYILANLDSVKPSRVRGKVQDRLRDLARELRNSKGASFWPLTFGFGCLLFMAGLVYFNQPHPLIFSPENNHTIIRVLHQYNDLDWKIQRVVSGIPQTPEVRRFDEKPPFEPGMTLTWLVVDDRGTVWSVKNINPYFVLLRENGVAALAPNCRHSHPEDWTKDHSVCKGEPQW